MLPYFVELADAWAYKELEGRRAMRKSIVLAGLLVMASRL